MAAYTPSKRYARPCCPLKACEHESGYRRVIAEWLLTREIMPVMVARCVLHVEQP